MRFLKTKLDDDVELLIEALDIDEASKTDPALLPRGAPAGRPTIVEGKEAELASAVRVARTIAKKVEGDLLATATPEDLLSEVSLEIALAFSAEGGIILVGKASGSASLKLTMRWARRAYGVAQEGAKP